MYICIISYSFCALTVSELLELEPSSSRVGFDGLEYVERKEDNDWVNVV